MNFNSYLVRYWSMTEKEFFTFSRETQRRIKHEYGAFLVRRCDR